MKVRDNLITHLLVLSMRTLLLIFAMRYVGFNAEQALILTVSIVMSMEIQ